MKLRRLEWPAAAPMNRECLFALSMGIISTKILAEAGTLKSDALKSLHKSVKTLTGKHILELELNRMLNMWQTEISYWLIN